jgi:hypothetical protein
VAKKDSLYVRSLMQHWHAFLRALHAWQMTVFLYRALGPGWNRNTVIGRVQMWHSAVSGKRCIRKYGVGPRHVSHSEGFSESSAPRSVTSRFVSDPRPPPFAMLRVPPVLLELNCLSPNNSESIHPLHR